MHVVARHREQVRSARLRAARTAVSRLANLMWVSCQFPSVLPSAESSPPFPFAWLPFRYRQTHEYTHNPAQFKLTAMERTRRFASSSGTASATGAADVPQIGNGGQGIGKAVATASTAAPASSSIVAVPSLLRGEGGAMGRTVEQAADDVGMANRVAKATTEDHREVGTREIPAGSARLGPEEADATGDVAGVAGVDAKRQKVGGTAA